MTNYTEPRYQFLSEESRKELYEQFDVTYVDYAEDGEQILTTNHAEYYRPLFRFEKGYIKEYKDLYMGKLIWSFRMFDGDSQFGETIETIYHDKDNVRETLQNMKDIFQKDYVEDHTYYAIRDDQEVYYGDINLDNILPVDCTDFWIIGIKIEKIRFIG